MGSVLAGKALNVSGSGPLRPYLRTKNVLDGRIDLEDVLSMPMTDAEFYRFQIADGDVLLNEGQSLDLVGRSAIYRGEFGGPCGMQNQLLRFRAHGTTSPEFAEHLFRHCQQAGIFSTIATQTTSVAHLGSSRFGKLRLWWPTAREEQQVIAEALTDVDGLIAALERQIAKKQAIKQGMMQRLLTGKTRLPGFAEPWRTTTIGDACETFSGGTPPTTRPEYYGGDIPWIASGDLNARRIESVDGRITRLGLERSAARLVPAGTPLIALYGATAGVVAMTQFQGAINQAVLAMVPVKVDAEFLFQWLSANRAAIIGRYRQGGQPNLSGAMVRNIEIPRPDPTEQRQIAGVLSELDSIVATLIYRLQKARAVKQGMMQQLLTGRTRLPVPGSGG